MENKRNGFRIQDTSRRCYFFQLLVYIIYYTYIFAPHMKAQNFVAVHHDCFPTFCLCFKNTHTHTYKYIFIYIILSFFFFPFCPYFLFAAKSLRRIYMYRGDILENLEIEILVTIFRLCLLYANNTLQNRSVQYLRVPQKLFAVFFQP